MDAVQAPQTPDSGLIPHTDSNKLSQPHVTEAQALEFFELIEARETVTDAAKKVGITRRTGHRLLERYEAKLDGVVKLLSAKALSVAEDWVEASAKAASKGDHRPARDLLLHAKAIEPVEDSARQGVNIAIVIGTPEQPIRMTPPQVAQVVESE